jgi:hypothetical protein
MLAEAMRSKGTVQHTHRRRLGPGHRGGCSLLLHLPSLGVVKHTDTLSGEDAVGELQLS